MVADMNICVCVIGVGFVGESLLQNFGRVFDCIGFDTSESRIHKLKQNGSFDSLPKKIELTSKAADLVRGTHYLVAVPTPIREDGSVNLDFVVSALRTVFCYAKQGSTVVIESTVPVGTTRDLLGSRKYRFNCGMSPERIDPGRAEPSPARIPKIVSGLTQKALRHIALIYAQAFETIVPVSKPEAAEMTKLYENCFRMVNIAYVCEISDACRLHGIDTNEVIDAAATKPFGFMPFYPGLGVGGHCIPVNPYYLFTNNRLPILERATSMMHRRPSKMAMKFCHRCTTSQTVSNQGEPLSPMPEPSSLPRLLIVGVAFKSGQSDTSGSPALTFARSLYEVGCEKLAFYDPLIEDGRISWLEKLHKRKWNRAYLDREFDGIAVCMKQKGTDFSVLRGLKKAFLWSFVPLDGKRLSEQSVSNKTKHANQGALKFLEEVSNWSLASKG